mmetsp:Transcript_12941/g.20330  ORF Transcript_12941/g.20330 Transcript_12941/m.20330 type:complete len:90 (-) Transcript_12941:172-441(-)
MRPFCAVSTCRDASARRPEKIGMMLNTCSPSGRNVSKNNPALNRIAKQRCRLKKKEELLQQHHHRSPDSEEARAYARFLVQGSFRCNLC